MNQIKSKTFGTRLRTLRQNAGLSTRKLGLMIGSSHAEIAYLEAGDRNPSFGIVQRLAKALKVQITDFMEL